MPTTGNIQERIQTYINAHPDYQGKPLSEFSSKLVATGVLTVEELDTLDSKSTFDVANSTTVNTTVVDSFQHSDEETNYVLEGERTFKQTNPTTGEVEVVTITYFKGKPSVKSVSSETGELLAVYSYSPAKLSTGEPVITIVSTTGDGDKIEQTVVSDVDENGNYTDDAFLSRSTMVTKDTVLPNGISASSGSKQRILIQDGNLVDIVSDGNNQKFVYTEYNGDSISGYDAQILHRKYQEIKEDGVLHSAQYSNGNTRVVVRNNDGFERITNYFNNEIDKKGLDASRHFSQSELEALNPREAKRGLQVGQTILVPTEYNANAPILTNRGTPEEAVSKYNQVITKQTIDRIYSSTIEEQTLNKNYTSYEELARETLKHQGINNPSAAQLNDRANELIILNQKAQLTKGSKVKIIANQSSSADVKTLSKAGFKQNFENNAFYTKFNSLDDNKKQQVLNVLKGYPNETDLNKLKAMVYEITGVNLYDTSLTVNEHKQGSIEAEFYNSSIPLEYFITNRLGLDLNSDTGKEVYLRLRSLPQEQLNNISASQFAASRTNQYGVPNNKISVGSDANLQTVVAAMAGQGIELRTSSEIHMENTDPRNIERRKKEEAISFLYNSVKTAYDMINSHLEELKSNMFSNLGEIILEDLKFYAVPPALKKLIEISGIKNGTVDGLVKSIFDKKDELNDMLVNIIELRNSKNFEQDYKAITGYDYNPDSPNPFRDEMFKNVNDFVNTSKFGGNVIEMAAMIYLTGGMGELGFVKNSGAAVEALTGSRALGMGIRGAVMLGTYTAGRETLNAIDDFRNADNLSDLGDALGDRGLKVLKHSGQSALFGFVGGASAEKLFNLSKGAQNFVTNQFSKVFGKGGEVVLLDGASASAQVFTPSVEAIAAGEKALSGGITLSSAEFLSKVAASTQGLNWVGKAANLVLETVTFAGLEITEQTAIGITKEIFSSESELKQAIANNTLDEYLTEKIKNAPKEIWEEFKNQGINLVMLKAISFAIGAHNATNLRGQYETLDNSTIYKTVIDGQQKVVVETSNSKMICNSTSDAISFLQQAMTVEAMMRASSESPKSEPVDAEYTDVTSEYADMPVYTRGNLPANTTVMPLQNLVISTVTGKPVGRLALAAPVVPEHLKTGFTPQQAELLAVNGVSVESVRAFLNEGVVRNSDKQSVLDNTGYNLPTLVTTSTTPNTIRPMTQEARTALGEKLQNALSNAKSEEAIDTYFEQVQSECAPTDQPYFINILNKNIRKYGFKYENGEKLPLLTTEEIHNTTLNIMSTIEPFKQDVLRIFDKMATAANLGEGRSCRRFKGQLPNGQINMASLDNKIERQIRKPIGDALIEAAKTNNGSAAIEGIPDMFGGRFLPDTPEEMHRVFSVICDAIKSGEFIPTEVENLCGEGIDPYLSEAQMKELDNLCSSVGYNGVVAGMDEPGCKTIRTTGYTSLHVNGFIKAVDAQGRTQLVPVEIQVRSEDVQSLLDYNHIPYDIINGKSITESKHPESVKLLQPLIDEFTRIGAKGNEKELMKLYKYQTACIKAAKEHTPYPSPTDYDLPEIVGYDNIISIDQKVHEIENYYK